MGGGEQRKVRSVFPGLGCEGAERDGAVTRGHVPQENICLWKKNTGSHVRV